MLGNMFDKVKLGEDDYTAVWGKMCNKNSTKKNRTYVKYYVKLYICKIKLLFLEERAQECQSQPAHWEVHYVHI